MVRVHIEATWEETWQVLVERGHTRVLVSEGDADHIVGYVTVRDLIVAKHANLPGIRSIVRHIDAVPETARATEVLTLMQEKQALIVLVVDEHGGVSGLLTLEDLIEELVGEIFEEHETRRPRIRREGEGCALVDGATPVHEVNRELGLGLPMSHEWVTLGGLVASRAGGVPCVGTTIMCEGTRIEVIEANERCILRARVTWNRASPSERTSLR
jgi:putative hemolysin